MRWPVSVKGVLGWDDAVVLLRNDRAEWELPGGRLESGEQPAEALRREMAEELGIRVSVGALLTAEAFEVVAGRWVLVVAYSCTAERPEVLTFSDEHSGVALVPRGSLETLPLPTVYLRAIHAAPSTAAQA